MGKVTPEPEADKELRGEILLPVSSLIKVETNKGTDRYLRSTVLFGGFETSPGI